MTGMERYVTKSLKPQCRAGRLALPLAAAGAAVWLLAAAPGAQAAATAYSNLKVDDFRILNGSGAQYDASDFRDLAVGNFTNANANSDGVGISADDLSTGNSGVPMQCLGTGCAGISDNDFSQQGSGFFSRSDARLEGAGISGLGGADSASAETVGELRTYSARRSNSATIGNISEFSFALGADDTMTFSLDATPVLDVAQMGGVGSVQASLAFSIQITDADGNSVFTWAPNGTLEAGELADPFSLNTSRGQLAEGSKTYDPGTGSFLATTGLLTAGETYTLSINHQSATSGRFTPVPEPGVLLLLGSGLLGLGAVARRGRSAGAGPNGTA